MSYAVRIGRALLKAISPDFHSAVSRRRDARRFEKIVKEVLTLTGGVVAAGPFRGMKYIPGSFGSALAPKLVGSYETEIMPWLEEASSNKYSRIVDIGCAEGYYAVGMAIRMPEVRVVAFDTSETARKLCAELAVLNGVDSRVEVRGVTDAAGINDVVDDRTMLICDCEGAEMELLDPVAAPRLKTCDMIVETHDFLGIDSCAVMKNRFGATHSIDSVEMTPRKASDYSLLSVLPRKYRAPAVDEMRPTGQIWLKLSRKDG